mmetsp:Transcript_31110/g.65650  ORF Transcript_31110/g.65650 Transcript_31110/m.65650 type:complete len:366 (+) Transcript_31110:328-1425(+)
MGYDLNYDAVGKTFAIFPKVSGSLSIIGSCLILRDIGKKWHKVPLTTEVVAHITVANLFIAFWECFLSTWMVPKDSGAYMAKGNTATCNAQGFIAVTMYAILALSYTILSVLYWIIVAQGWTEQKTQRRKIRFYFLGLPIIIAVALSTPPLFFEMYNFTGTYSCNFQEYPLNCDFDPATACTRGGNARLLQTISCICSLVCTVIILVFMSLLVRSVRIQESASDRYLSKGQTKRREMTRKTFWQAVRYFLVFFITNLPFYIYAVYDIIQASPPISITFIYIIVWPMFGVFNSFVYFRPRYLSYSMKNPEKSWIHCLLTVLDINLVSWSSRSDASVPPSVSGLIDDEDLSSPLFSEEGSVNGGENL